MIDSMTFNIDDIIAHQKIMQQQDVVTKANNPTPPSGSVTPSVLVEEDPLHLAPPRGSETFDISDSFTLTYPTVTETLIDWTTPDGAITIWRGYAFSCNTPLGTTCEWTMKVDGNPVFKWHGSSINGFKKTLALGADLSQIVYALKELRGGQRIVIDATLSAPVLAGATVAARIMGWVISERMAMARAGS